MLSNFQNPNSMKNDDLNRIVESLLFFHKFKYDTCLDDIIIIYQISTSFQTHAQHNHIAFNEYQSFIMCLQQSKIKHWTPNIKWNHCNGILRNVNSKFSWKISLFTLTYKINGKCVCVCFFFVCFETRYDLPVVNVWNSVMDIWIWNVIIWSISAVVGNVNMYISSQFTSIVYMMICSIVHWYVFS